MTDEFDRIVEPLRTNQRIACEEFLDEIVRARNDGECALSWQGLERSWSMLGAHDRRALKELARAVLDVHARGIRDRDRKLAAVLALED